MKGEINLNIENSESDEENQKKRLKLDKQEDDENELKKAEEDENNKNTQKPIFLYDKYKKNENLQLFHPAFLNYGNANKIRFKQVLDTIDDVTEINEKAKDENFKIPALRYSCIRLLGFLSYETNSSFQKNGGNQFLDFFSLPPQPSFVNQMRNHLVHKHHEYEDNDIINFVEGFVETLKNEISTKLHFNQVNSIQTPDISHYIKNLNTLKDNNENEIKSSNRTADIIENDFRDSVGFLKSFSDPEIMKNPFKEERYAGFYILLKLGELYDEIDFNKIRTSLNRQELENLKYYYDRYHELSHVGKEIISFEDVTKEVEFLLNQKKENSSNTPSTSPKNRERSSSLSSNNSHDSQNSK